MLIRLLPKQIADNWDMIKYVVVMVEKIPEKDRQLYLNRLLHSLMCNKAQVFFRLSDDRREVKAVEVTRITIDEVTGEKSLFLQSLFSFAIVDETEWQENIDFICDFAKREGCKKVTGYSTNARVDEIMKKIGFKERFKCYIMEV